MCERTSSTQNRLRSKLSVPQPDESHGRSENEFFQSLNYSKISFFYQSHSKKSQILPQQNLKAIIVKKKKIIQNLKSLQNQENNVRASIRNKNNRHKYRKAQILDQKPEDNNLIRQLIRQRKKHEQSLQKITKSLQQKRIHQLIKQKQQSICKITQMRERNKKKAEQKIKKLKERQQQREQIKRKSIERESEVKKIKYAFEKYKTIEHNDQKNIKDNIKQQISLSQILKHQKQYRSLTEEQGKVRNQKVKQFKKQFKNRKCKQYPEGKFASILKEQNRKEKMKEIQKLSFAQRYSNRVAQYGKIVRQVYHPRYKQKTEPNLSSHTQYQKQKQIKSVSDIKQIGNNYLSYNKSHKNKKSLQNKVQYVNSLEQTKPQYKNYLKDFKMGPLPRKFSSKFNRIFENTESPDRILKLKNLIQCEQQRFPNPDQNKLQQLTEAKLRLINNIL